MSIEYVATIVLAIPVPIIAIHTSSMLPGVVISVISVLPGMYYSSEYNTYSSRYTCTYTCTGTWYVHVHGIAVHTHTCARVHEYVHVYTCTHVYQYVQYTCMAYLYCNIVHV